MEKGSRIVLALSSIFVLLLFLLLFFAACIFRRKLKRGEKSESEESGKNQSSGELEPEELIGFQGGQNLTIFDVLDAPGEVVGKSGYGTLYKAFLQRSGSVVLLRFLRPVSTERGKDIRFAIRIIGSIRHPNLVSLRGFYSGPRGEKLLVHPFFSGGTLAHFLRGGSDESRRWATIHRISFDIAKGLDHLHTGLQRPLIHGNLKSKNILLDSNHRSYLSDFGLHLLLNPTAGQEMLEASAYQGYKAPELIKMKDASKESDIYSLGVIFLELLTGTEAIYKDPSSSRDLYLPISMRIAIMNHRVPEIFDSKLLKECGGQNVITEEGLLKYFHLAMSCCSPSPLLRPDTKQIVRKLEELVR